MIYNIFDTEQEAIAAQEYDTLFQKLRDFSDASGIPLETIRDNGLHIQDESGGFPLDALVYGDTFNFEPIEAYERVKSIWRMTTAWAQCYGYRGAYVYLSGESDRVYETVDIEDMGLIELIDAEHLPGYDI